MMEKNYDVRVVSLMIEESPFKKVETTELINQIKKIRKNLTVAYRKLEPKNI